jgi:hypothetical protein
MNFKKTNFRVDLNIHGKKCQSGPQIRKELLIYRKEPTEKTISK